MGAFILYKTKVDLDIKCAKDLFQRKGFAEPKSVNLGKWRLLQYQKIFLVDVENFIIDNSQMIFCCGTVIYYGLSYRDSLKRLLKDFQSGSVNQSELIGHFCLLYWNGLKLIALTDTLNTFHVFVNDDISCFSSSFLGILCASPRPLPLNRLAVCEKMATGYIISPDTLVQGILQLNDEVASSFSQNSNDIEFVQHIPRPQIKLHDNGIDKSLSIQIDLLEKHFSKLEALHEEYSGELGISDGYDSRIVLACSKGFAKKLSLHTHASSNTVCHDISKSIVQRMAQATGSYLKIVPTQHVLYCEPDKMANTLDDSLHLFDGRCSYNMGAFSETYTKAYRKEILGDSLGFTLNGLGGEVYRNYYSLQQRYSIHLRHWMNNSIYYSFSKDGIEDKDLFEEMHEHRLHKINSRLGLQRKSRVDLLWVRRYYSEVRMPDCDAINSDAQNQLSFYHMPFIQPEIIYEGINANPYIGLAGSYQMALIHKLSSKLSSYHTHYGYAANKKIPMRFVFKTGLAGHIPEQLRWLRKRLVMPSRNERFINQTQIMLKKCEVLSESKDCLLESGTIKNFDATIIDNAQRATTMFVGTFLRQFQNKLKW